MWVIVYSFNILVISLALGCCAMHLPRMLPAPRLSRFLTGFCLTPFCVGLWMLMVAAIWPGAPPSVFVFSMPGGALLLLAFYGCRTLARLSRSVRRTRLLKRNTRLQRMIVLTLMIVTILVGIVITANSRRPLLSKDILEYSSSALVFAKARTVDALNDMGYKGAADGSLRGYMHGCLWPLYLGYALITNGNQPLGYPNDYAVRLAPQITIVFMILSVFALAQTNRRLGVAALVVIVLLQVPAYNYITTNSSRDAFRIIPLLLLATALSGLTPYRLRRRLPLRVLFPPLALSALALAGHTLGGIIVMLILVAWLLWSLVGRAAWLNMVKVSCAMLIGLALSGGQYIKAYYETGAVDGKTIQKKDAVTVAAGPGIGAKIKIIQTKTSYVLAQDGYKVGLIGMLAAGVVIVWCLRQKHIWRRSNIPFMGLLVLICFLPFIGLVDFFGMTLSNRFLINPRYALHWYPFGAVCIAFVFWYGYELLIGHQKKTGETWHQRERHKRWMGILPPLIVLAIAFTAIATVITSWIPYVFFNYQKLLNERFLPITVVVQGLVPGERLLLEDDRYNYYLENRAMVMFSQPARWIVKAESDAEVERRLTKSRIVLVALEEKSLDNTWADTALLRVAQRKCRAPMQISSLHGYMNVFIVGDFAAYYNRLLDRFDAEPLSEDDFDRTMFIDCYVNEVISRGSAAINKALADQRKRASEHSPWHCIVLGRLLEKTGQPDDAEREYRRAKEIWPSPKLYPTYYDEMNLARAWAAVAAGETEKAVDAFNTIAHQTASPLSRAKAIAAVDRLPNVKKTAVISSLPWDVTSCHIPASWMIPDELFWKWFVPRTTYYKLAPIRGCFTMSMFESQEGEILRVTPDGGGRPGSDYIQVGLWLPERRLWVRQAATNSNQCLPVLQPNAALHFSAAVRLSSTNEDARLLIRGLGSSADGSKSVVLRSTDWVTSGVSCVVASDFKEGRLFSRYLAALPFNRLPGRWRGLAGLASFFPDEQKYAPVIQWTPKATNAWMEVRDARLLLVAP